MKRIDKRKIFFYKKISPPDSIYQKILKLVDDARIYYGLSKQKNQALEGHFFDVAQQQASNLGLHALKAEKVPTKNSSLIISVIEDKAEIIALKKPRFFTPKKILTQGLFYLFPAKLSISQWSKNWTTFFTALYASAVLIFVIWLSLRSLTNNPKSFSEALPYLFALTFFALLGFGILNCIGRSQRIITLDLMLLYRRLFNENYEYGKSIKDIILNSRHMINRRQNLIYALVFLVSITAISLFVPLQNIVLLTLFSLVIGLIFLLIKQVRAKLLATYQKAHERFKNDYHYFLTVFPDLSTLHLIDESTKNIRESSLNDFHAFKRTSFLQLLEKTFGFFIPFIIVALVTLNASFFHRPLNLAHVLLSLLVGCLFYFHLRVFIHSFKRHPRPQEVAFSMQEKIAIPTLLGKIELAHVFFQYPGLSEPILNNIDLVIKPKTLVGVFGASGSGKSTLMKILMAHHRPTRGQLIFDDHDTASLDLNALKKHMGIVTPDSRLMAGTLLENIFVTRTFSKREIEMLLSHRLFWPLLDLPMGLNTYVMWHGHNISPKIASLTLLARALIHQPATLFLDEIYLGQTLNEEKETLADLKAFAITTIITSHHTELHYYTDQSYTLHQGKLTKR